MYYLQSRYYDANIGRFINADESVFATIIGKNQEGNLYTYCGNNTICFKDPNGFIKLSVSVRPPNYNSSVVWAYKNGSITVGHVFVSLDPEGNKTLRSKNVIHRGFYPDTTRTLLITVTKSYTKGKIINEKNTSYNYKVTYTIKNHNIIKSIIFCIVSLQNTI